MISVPEREPRGPRPPGWWQTFWRRDGTIAEHNGVTWILIAVGAADQSWKQWERLRGER